MLTLVWFCVSPVSLLRYAFQHVSVTPTCITVHDYPCDLFSSSMSPCLLTLDLRYLTFPTCFISMSSNVIITWCSVDDHYFSFREIDVELVHYKSCIPVGHTLFKFFICGCSLRDVVRIYVSINCLELGLITSVITRYMSTNCGC